MNRHRWKRETRDSRWFCALLCDAHTDGRTDGRRKPRNEVRTNEKELPDDDDDGAASDDDDDEKGHDDDAWTRDDANGNQERKEKDTSRCGARRGGRWERPDAWDGE